MVECECAQPIIKEVNRATDLRVEAARVLWKKPVVVLVSDGSKGSPWVGKCVKGPFPD